MLSSIFCPSGLLPTTLIRILAIKPDAASQAFVHYRVLSLHVEQVRQRQRMHCPQV